MCEPVGEKKKKKLHGRGASSRSATLGVAGDTVAFMGASDKSSPGVGKATMGVIAVLVDAFVIAHAVVVSVLGVSTLALASPRQSLCVLA